MVLSGPSGRLAEAITLSDRLRLTAALEVATPPALDAMFEQAVADGSEGLVCKAVGRDSIYQAGARGWQWIKLKRDYRTELATPSTSSLSARTPGEVGGRGGAVLLAAYDPETELYQTVGKCGTGFSDAELAALPARLEPLIRTQRPARVDSRPRMCGSSQAWSWKCSVRSSRCRRTTPPAGASSRTTLGCRCGFSPAAGATTRSPRTPLPLSNSSSFTAPHAGRRPAEELGYAPVP